MAAPVVVQAAYQDGHNTQPTPTFGSAPTPGNFVVGQLAYDSNLTDPGVNGWAYLGNAGTSNAKIAIYWREVMSGDGATYPTMDGGGNTYMGATLQEVSGISGGFLSALDQLSFDVFTGGTTTTTTPLTTAHANELAIGGGAEWTIFGPVPLMPSPWTTDAGGSGFATGIAVAHNDYPTSGSSVSYTIDWQSGTNSGATAFTLLLSSGSGTTTADYSPGTITLTPATYTGTAAGEVAELDVAVLAKPETHGVVAELDVAVVATPPTNAQVAELDVAVLLIPSDNTTGGLAELDVAVLAYIGPCSTRRCQVWKITRKDGTVFAYTSHDEPVTWVGVEYLPCKSLAASAAESASELNSVGTVELTGMLDDEAISQEDIYAGLFDDAVVDIWMIPWDGQPDDGAPFRIGGGNIGKLTRQEHAFTSEVLGPAARLQQASLVSFYTPGCDWDFGVLRSDGIGCPVHAESLKLAAVPVTGQKARTLVFFDVASPGGTTIWNGGKVRWLTGRNAGVICQVDTVDFSAQALSLWDIAPYPPLAGDTFDLIPGCPKTVAACKTYGVYISFGGFDDIPGPAALQSNADSLFTGS